MDLNPYKQLASTMNEAYNLLKKYHKPEIIRKWININTVNIKTLNKVLHNNKKLTVGEKSSIIATTAILKSLNKKFQKIGGSLVQNNGVEWENLENVFENRVKTGLIVNLKHKDVKEFLNECEKTMFTKIQDALKELNSVKVNTVLMCKFVAKKHDQKIEEIKHFTTKNYSILQSTNFKDWFNVHVRGKLESKIEEFQEKDSGWSLLEILHLQVNVNKYILH